MKVTKNIKISILLDKYPFLVEELEKINPKYSLLKNKIARATMGKVATLNMVATIGSIKTEDLITAISKIVDKHQAEPLEYDSEEEKKRLETLKSIIKDMHKQGSNEQALQKFNELLIDINPDEIKNMEQQLVMEGMPVKEIQKLCDLHVGVFKDALGKNEAVTMPAGHPVHTYQAENRKLETAMEEAECLLKGLKPDSAPAVLAEMQEKLNQAIDKIASVDKHYVRKENQLFPFMEKHGITAPPQVMWGVHDEIRGMIKEVRLQLKGQDVSQIIKAITALNHAITEMIFKEDKILFPMVLQNFTEEEWSQVRNGEDELGYILEVMPGNEWQPEKLVKSVDTVGGKVNLDTGKMTVSQINAMLKHLPLDVSFVDTNDEVAYYSDTKDRLLPRTPGVIGRKVQNCHPPKSVNVVQEILDEFRAGRKDTAEFWITMHGIDLHIRYFAVRDDKNTYMGCLEVTQDITAIKKLAGERRLLDWGK